MSPPLFWGRIHVRCLKMQMFLLVLFLSVIGVGGIILFRVFLESTSPEQFGLISLALGFLLFLYTIWGLKRGEIWAKAYSFRRQEHPGIFRFIIVVYFMYGAMAVLLGVISLARGT